MTKFHLLHHHHSSWHELGLQGVAPRPPPPPSFHGVVLADTSTGPVNRRFFYNNDNPTHHRFSSYFSSLESSESEVFWPPATSPATPLFCFTVHEVDFHRSLKPTFFYPYLDFFSPGAIATDTLPRFVSCRRLLPSLLDVTPLVHVLAGGVTRRPRRAAPIIVFLPTATLYGYSHVVVLSGDGHDSFHFELLVLDGEARTQTFSSATGAWGPVTEHLAKASRCLRRRRREVPGELLLVRSVDGRLGLLVAEALAMAVWTLSEDSRSWARRVVVDRARMLRPLTLRYNPLACLNFELEWFGETSGTVVLQLQGAGILLLQLQTGEVNQLRNQDEHNLLYYNDPQPLGCCPYEMNMVSVLSAMRKF